MEGIINNLDVAGLESLWNATFTDPEDKFNKVIEDNGYEISEMKQILVDEITTREDRVRRVPKRPKKDDEFMESLMGMEYQPLIQHKQKDEFMESLMGMEDQPLIRFKQPRRRKHIPEALSLAIKEQHSKRQKHIDQLHAAYENSNAGKEDFYEWLRNKNAPSDDARVDAFIDSIDVNTVIDFQQLNKSDREKAFERMKTKLEDIIGELAMTKKFLINFRINGQWKSRTLTPQLWDRLMDSLDKKEFIYGKEVFEVDIVHNSLDDDSDLFKLAYFDAISFTPIKGSGSTRKDNRDSFFAYFNRSDIDLSRYQIFDSIVNVVRLSKGKNSMIHASFMHSSNMALALIHSIRLDEGFMSEN